MDLLDYDIPDRAIITLVFVLLSYCFIAQASAQFSKDPSLDSVAPQNIYRAKIEDPAYSGRSSADSTTSVARLESYRPKWYSTVTNLPGDMTRFATTSFQIDKLPLYAGIAALTVGLMTVDNRLWRNERSLYTRSSVFRNFTDDMVWVGDGRVEFGVAGVFAAYGLAFDNSRAVRTGSEVAEAILASGIVDQLLKHISGRQRPQAATEPGGDWTFVPGQLSYLKHEPQYDAFPSGHITSATALLVVIGENYPELTWFKPASYVMMGAIAMSLDAYGYHWWSDIPLGIFLGYTFGEIVSHPLSFSLGHSRPGESPELLFQPVMIPDGLGMGLSLSL